MLSRLHIVVVISKDHSTNSAIDINIAQIHLIVIILIGYQAYLLRNELTIDFSSLELLRHIETRVGLVEWRQNYFYLVQTRRK